MFGSSSNNQLTRVRYRPIDAAIRWSGLARHEQQIIDVLQGRAIPETTDFPQWPSLRLFAERIYDAILNDELPYAVNGVTVRRKARVPHSDLTVRHVDLKSWMCRYYPEDRPDFLFSPIEQELLPPTISADALKALTLERGALRIRVRQLNQEIVRLNDELARLRVDNSANTRTAADSASENAHGLSARGETTYLNVIGGLLDMLLGQSPSGQRYSVFASQEAIITALVATHGNKLGVAKRTLERKFAAARRTLADS